MPLPELIVLAVIFGLIFLAVATILMPLHVMRIKKEIIEMNKSIRSMAEDIRAMARK